ncbi:hypothetical protein [uncultured Paraglaciecola sp.]|uniref:hypothetical protein n=1 Tax=uncultured Paraglaciecola sp. TaxID=1765024 RepID=UPI002594AB0A|nr:hypothetical protein [uncultured Paraglaciecola sp.]
MKQKLLTILLTLTTFSAHASLDKCRKYTVDFGEYMEEQAIGFEEKEEAQKVRKHIEGAAKYYEAELNGYAEMYNEYKETEHEEQARSLLKAFDNVTARIALEIAEETNNRYKAQATLTPGRYGEMEVNWYISYGQIIKNDKADDFRAIEDIYKNIKTGRPAIFNSSETLIGSELNRTEMVEFESYEVMGMYANKMISSSCEKYLDYVEAERNLAEAVLAGNSQDKLSKSFVFLVRSADKPLFGDYRKLGLKSRMRYYANADEALLGYEEKPEN